MREKTTHHSAVLTAIVLLALAWTAPLAQISKSIESIDVPSFDPAPAATLQVTFPINNFGVFEGDTRNLVVVLSRPMNSDDPAEVTVDYSVEPAIAEAGRDYVQPPPQTLTFVNGGDRFVLISLETLQDDKHEGTERLILRLTNPVGVERGRFMQAAVSIIDDDPYDPLLLDDFERQPYLWDGTEDVSLGSSEIAGDDPLALPGQGAYERVLDAALPIRVDVDMPGRLCNNGNGVVPVVLKTSDAFDAMEVDHAGVTLGEAHEAHVDRRTGLPRRHVEDADGDGDLDLVFHFRYEETGLPCNAETRPFSGKTWDGRTVAAGPIDAAFRRDFPLEEDWSAHDGLKFWYHGDGNGADVAVELLDNRAPDPGPGGWELVWSDEFDDPAGTPPDPANWAHEIGDGTANGIPGWGNSELQYYTNSTDNAATDGQGNLVITAREADGSLYCFYGPCWYTSARLISWHRAEFAYGRIESRILAPDGDRGLWPAFWSLGTNIGRVGWPRSGEIDFYEYVSRLPYEVFGTIHGPGYEGGASFGNIISTFPERVSDSYHVIAVEWQPDRIEWYFDGTLYHVATPSDVAPRDWVFNGANFLILNMAVGGFFGGPVGPLTTFPQELKIDYVRVYQAPDSAERWQATFTDDIAGWREVEIPFAAFGRAAEQPTDAPDDGLGLDEVWGYGFRLPESGSPSGRVLVDGVRLVGEE